MYVDCAVDGDAAKPEEDAAVMAVERRDALECCAKGVLENVFGEFGYWKSWENCLAVELVSKPREQDTSGLSVALTNSGNDFTLVVEWGQVAGVCSRQGRLLSSHLATRTGSQSYTMDSHTQPCLCSRNKL